MSGNATEFTTYPLPSEVLDAYTQSSGCNYKVRIGIEYAYAYSGYFTIIKANDTSGIPEAHLCPGKDDSLIRFSQLRTPPQVQTVLWGRY